MDAEPELIVNDEQAIAYLRQHLKPGQLTTLARLYREGSDHGQAWLKVHIKDRRAESISIEKPYR